MCGENIGQRGQRRLEVGFLDPILKTEIGTCLGTKSPHVRVHERTKGDQAKHEKLKNVNPQQPSHPSPPPFHGNTSFPKFTNTLLLVPTLITRIHQRPVRIRLQAGYPVLWNERDSEYHWLILIFVKKERYISGVASGPKAVPMLPQAFQAIFVVVVVDFCMNLTGYGL